MAMRPPTPRGSKSRSPWARMLLWIYFPALLLLAGFMVLLWKSGFALIVGKPLEHASWAFVLPGETTDCEASQMAARDFVAGRIDTLVTLGGRSYQTHWMTEWSREYLEGKGVANDRLFEMRLDAVSALDETRQVLRLARLQNIDTLHLITSNFQARRFQRLFQRLSGGLPVIVIHPVTVPSMSPSSWWATPQSQALWVHSWLGTLHAYATTAFIKPDMLVAEVRNLSPDIWTPQELTHSLPEPTREKSSSSADTSQALGLLDSAARILDSLKGNPASEANDSGPAVRGEGSTGQSATAADSKSDAKNAAKTESKSDSKADSKSDPKADAKSEGKAAKETAKESAKDSNKDSGKKAKGKK